MLYSTHAPKYIYHLTVEMAYLYIATFVILLHQYTLCIKSEIALINDSQYLHVLCHTGVIQQRTNNTGIYPNDTTPLILARDISGCKFSRVL